jgi:Iap family predicted aminopeptidase
MMNSEARERLHQTVRVHKDGTVTYNVIVLSRGGRRVVAAPPLRAHRDRWYAGLSSEPPGVNLTAIDRAITRKAVDK